MTRAEYSSRAVFHLVLLAGAGFFTAGITWLFLAWRLRSVPTRIDDDGVHFVLRRTIALSEVEEVLDVAFVRRPYSAISVVQGRGLGIRLRDGTEIIMRTEYLANADELRRALHAGRIDLA